MPFSALVMPKVGMFSRMSQNVQEIPQRRKQAKKTIGQNSFKLFLETPGGPMDPKLAQSLYFTNTQEVDRGIFEIFILRNFWGKKTKFSATFEKNGKIQAF